MLARVLMIMIIIEPEERNQKPKVRSQKSNDLMSVEDTWKVVLFLSNMKSLPPMVRRNGKGARRTKRKKWDHGSTQHAAGNWSESLKVTMLQRESNRHRAGKIKKPPFLSELASRLRTSLPSSPSPQTVIAGERLNHFSFGTAGSVSSQSANKPSCLAEISRDRIRSSR